MFYSRCPARFRVPVLTVSGSQMKCKDPSQPSFLIKFVMSDIHLKCFAQSLILVLYISPTEKMTGYITCTDLGTSRIR